MSWGRRGTRARLGTPRDGDAGFSELGSSFRVAGDLTDLLRILRSIEAAFGVTKGIPRATSLRWTRIERRPRDG